ncbi:DUF805 domain-containing protein [Labilibaculum manganireducens]|uniref:DUF805 domain-containing protein n=1 Tax=Labilibaculum manganireducens TaxID=1940525 RepID=UPI0029F5175B|nr:DUF805 domain-containing protein [Labilibaculum manganireducens]
MSIFNTNDRLRRTDYIFQKLISFTILMNTVLVLKFMEDSTDNEIIGGVHAVTILVAFFGFIIYDALTTVKRLHDVDKKGSWYFARLIPIYNIIFELSLIFEKGTRGMNTFGFDPREIEKDVFKKRIVTNSIFLILLISSIVYFMDVKKQQDIEVRLERIENPQVNDSFIYTYEDTTGYNYNIFKVDRIVADSLYFVTIASYAYMTDSDASFALSENGISSSDFWGEEAVLSKKELTDINISRVIRPKNSNDNLE